MSCQLNQRSARCLSFTPRGACPLRLVLYAWPADFTFLGNPVHLDHCVRVIRKVKLITSKSDIKRRLKQPADAVKVRFATTPETEFTVKLADP
jgi:hypothetical protein